MKTTLTDSLNTSHNIPSAVMQIQHLCLARYAASLFTIVKHYAMRRCDCALVSSRLSALIQIEIGPYLTVGPNVDRLYALITDKIYQNFTR